MMYDLSEIDRKLAMLIRFGVITELDTSDPKAPRVKCSVGGLSTDWIPWPAGRAGSTRYWSAPRPGEQVAVFAPYGDTTQGFILPGFYQDNYPAPSNSQDVDMIVFPDGTTFEYDSAAGHYTQTIQGSGTWTFNCKTATVKADTSVTIDTPEATMTGNLTVQKNLAVVGGMDVKGEGTSGGISTFHGTINIEGGDVNADGTHLKTHHHQEHDGPNTGPALP